MMKKNFFTLTFLCVSISIFSQQYTGKVGINTQTPSATLDIVSAGKDATTKALEINNTADTPVEMLTILNNGNVGVNIDTPQTKLHIVAGSEKAGFQLQDGSEGAEKFLRSDANGAASWQTFQAWGESTTVDMVGRQTFNTAAEAALGTPTVFNPTTTTIIGSNSVGVTFPSTSRLHLPKGRYLVFVRADLAGSEFMAFGAWRDSAFDRFFYSYYGDFLDNPSFIADFRDREDGDALYFQALGLTKNPNPTYYAANYTNNNWHIIVTILKIN